MCYPGNVPGHLKWRIMSLRISDAYVVSIHRTNRPKWRGFIAGLAVLAFGLVLAACGPNTASSQNSAPAPVVTMANVPDGQRVGVWSPEIKIGDVVYTSPDFIRRTAEDGDPIAIDAAKVGLVPGGSLTVKMTRTSVGFDADLPADTRLLIDPNAKGVKVTLVG